MLSPATILTFIKQCADYTGCFLRTWLKPDFSKDMEILLLRSQLSLFQQQIENGKRSKPRATAAFRLLTVCLSNWFTNWKSPLMVVKPETVIVWKKNMDKFVWRLKSRKKPGRPKISRQTIALIKRIHKENPLLSPEKIHELLVSKNISDAPAPNTIAKYLPTIRKPPSEKQLQSWRTFIHNHNVWSMDFAVVFTINFKILYVFVLVSHARRRIEHIAVTTNPTAPWTAQQIREATPFGKQPTYLLHDNDAIFTASYLQTFLTNTGIGSVRTSIKSPWQNPIAERTIQTIRHEVLNHMIPINEKHLSRILHEYVRYYNRHRTHRGVDCQTPDVSPILPETTCAQTMLIGTPILGGLYHAYKKVA